MSVVKALCVSVCVGERERKNSDRERERGILHSLAVTPGYTSLSRGAEAESVGQMFANRPVAWACP